MGYSFKLAAFVGALLVACAVGLPPTPVMHTRSEHYMHLEIESNLVEEGSEYSEGKEVHIAILRVVFDQPVVIVIVVVVVCVSIFWANWRRSYQEKE